MGKRTCPRCNGQGTIRCSWCKGTGDTGIMAPYKCGHCDGTGEIQCPNCHGTGEIET